jgi:hypothetical protein
MIYSATVYASARGMRLNKKCKEMVIDPLQYRLPFQDVVRIGKHLIESVM